MGDGVLELWPLILLGFLVMAALVAALAVGRGVRASREGTRETGLGDSAKLKRPKPIWKETVIIFVALGLGLAAFWASTRKNTDDDSPKSSASTDESVRDRLDEHCRNASGGRCIQP